MVEYKYPSSDKHSVKIPKDVYKLYLVSFVANLQFFGAVTIPFFTEFANLNYKNIFALESIYLIFLFITELPTGIFADRFSRKSALSLGLLFLGLGYLTFGLYSNFGFFVLAELFCAFGAAFLSGVDKALLYELLKKQALEKDAIKFFARLQGWGTLGITFSLPLGSFLAKSHFFAPYPQSLSKTFLLSAIISIIMSIVTMTIKEESTKYFKKSFTKLALESYYQIRKNKKLLFLSIASAIVNAPIFFIIWLYQPLLLQTNLDVKYLGLISCVFNLLGFLFLRYIIKIESLLGLKNLFFLSGFIPGILFICMSFTHGSYSIIIMIILAASIKSLRTPLINHYINSEIGNDNRATVLSAISMFQRLSVFIFNPIVGYVSDVSINKTFLFLGIFVVVSCLMIKKFEKYFDA